MGFVDFYKEYTNMKKWTLRLSAILSIVALAVGFSFTRSSHNADAAGKTIDNASLGRLILNEATTKSVGVPNDNGTLDTCDVTVKIGLTGAGSGYAAARTDSAGCFVRATLVWFENGQLHNADSGDLASAKLSKSLRHSTVPFGTTLQVCKDGNCTFARGTQLG